MNEFITKHSATLKYFANWGIASVICGYFLIVELPSIRKANETQVEKIYAANKEDRAEARLHGTQAAERLARSIDGLRDEQKEHNAKVRANQETLIKIQEAALAKQSKEPP
jgi:hypothetical protein